MRKAGALVFVTVPDKAITCDHTQLVMQSNQNMVVRCNDAAGANIGLTFSTQTGNSALGFISPLTLTMRDDCMLILSDGRGLLAWDSVRGVNTAG